jgi:hypothetical protein
VAMASQSSSTMHLYRILQLVVFVFCSCTRVSWRLIFSDTVAYSTWNERGNCRPICPVLLAPLLLAGIRNCTIQICIFFWCLATRATGSSRFRLHCMITVCSTSSVSSTFSFIKDGWFLLHSNKLGSYSSHSSE